MDNDKEEQKRQQYHDGLFEFATKHLSQEELGKMKKELEKYSIGFFQWWETYKQQVVDFMVFCRQHFSNCIPLEMIDKCDRVLITLRKVYPDLFPPEPEPIIVVEHKVIPMKEDK